MGIFEKEIIYESFREQKIGGKGEVMNIGKIEFVGKLENTGKIE